MTDRRLALEASFRAHDARRAAALVAVVVKAQTAIERKGAERVARLTRAAKGNAAAIMACRVPKADRLAAVRDVIQAALAVEKMIKRGDRGEA